MTPFVYENRKFKLKAIGENCLVYKHYPVLVELFGKELEYEIFDTNIFISDIEDKLSILIMDTQDDYAGFFKPIDLYKQSAIDNYSSQQEDWKGIKSNEKHILYIKAYAMRIDFVDSISTVIHEFQHLLREIHDTVMLNSEYAMWYTEMLSVLTEDLFYNYLHEIDENYIGPYSWYLDFNKDTNYGVTYWNDEPVGYDELAIGYAVNYTFASFLFRNFSGVELLKNMTSHENKNVNSKAIDYALEKTFPGKGYTFEYLLSLFPYVISYAHVNDTTGKYLTLNKSVTFEAGDAADKKSFTIPAINLYKFENFNYQHKATDIITPNGFIYTRLPDNCTQVTYEVPTSNDIEIIFK